MSVTLQVDGLRCLCSGTGGGGWWEARHGIAAPPKLPASRFARLHAEIVRILNQPDIRERILADGSEPVGNSPEKSRQYMLADLVKWAKFDKEIGAKLDRDDAEWVKENGSLSHLSDTCAR